MGKKYRVCCICGKKLPIGNYGNNPEPIKPYSAGTCCDDCNREKVIPARLLQVSCKNGTIGVIGNE